MSHSTGGALATRGERIRRHRLARELSLRTAAKEIGIAFSHLSDIERGSNCPSADILARLATLYGVTMDELWHGDQPRPTAPSEGA